MKSQLWLDIQADKRQGHGSLGKVGFSTISCLCRKLTALWDTVQVHFLSVGVCMKQHKKLTQAIQKARECGK